ncbi:MAG: hypothetical protein J5716_08950 [Alphaproteobacteria bacterium]|nr:hypothetical protein [Alphaproteobacteria bacterium]
MTFENEIKKYLKNKTTVKNVFSHPEILPETKGIYIYTAPDDDTEIEFSDTTTAKETRKGSSLLYPKYKLEDKFSRGDKKILYIGCTPKGTLRERTALRAKYSKEKIKDIRARGGRALFQIKNWESIGLNFYYYEIEECEALEEELLSLYKEQYDVLPVANMKI